MTSIDEGDDDLLDVRIALIWVGHGVDEDEIAEAVRDSIRDMKHLLAAVFSTKATLVAVEVGVLPWTGVARLRIYVSGRVRCDGSVDVGDVMSATDELNKLGEEYLGDPPPHLDPKQN